jgi:hypothetical protein
MLLVLKTYPKGSFFWVTHSVSPKTVLAYAFRLTGTEGQLLGNSCDDNVQR